MVAPLIGGAILGCVLVLIARRRPVASERRIYAAALVIAAMVYFLLALAGGATSRWLAVEGGGFLLFSLAAWAGLRRPAALTLGWAAHVAWDLALHIQEAPAAYTPDWYPWLCVSFDLVIAAAAMWPRKA